MVVKLGESLIRRQGPERNCDDSHSSSTSGRFSLKEIAARMRESVETKQEEESMHRTGLEKVTKSKLVTGITSKLQEEIDAGHASTLGGSRNTAYYTNTSIIPKSTYTSESSVKSYLERVKAADEALETLRARLSKPNSRLPPTASAKVNNRKYRYLPRAERTADEGRDDIVERNSSKQELSSHTTSSADCSSMTMSGDYPESTAFSSSTQDPHKDQELRLAAEDKIAQLYVKVSDMDHKLSVAEEHCRHERKSKQEVEAKVVVLEKNERRLTHQLRQAKKSKGEAEGKLVTMIERMAKMDHVLASTEEKMKVALKIHKKAAMSKAAHEQEVSELHGIITVTKKKLSRGENEIRALKDENVSNSKCIEMMRQLIEEKEKELSTLTKEWRGKEESHSKEIGQLKKKCEQQLTFLRQRIVEKDRNIANMRDEQRAQQTSLATNAVQNKYLLSSLEKAREQCRNACTKRMAAECELHAIRTKMERASKGSISPLPTVMLPAKPVVTSKKPKGGTIATSSVTSWTCGSPVSQDFETKKPAESADGQPEEATILISNDRIPIVVTTALKIEQTEEEVPDESKPQRTQQLKLEDSKKPGEEQDSQKTPPKVNTSNSKAKDLFTLNKESEATPEVNRADCVKDSHKELMGNKAQSSHTPKLTIKTAEPSKTDKKESTHQEAAQGKAKPEADNAKPKVVVKAQEGDNTIDIIAMKSADLLNKPVTTKKNPTLKESVGQAEDIGLSTRLAKIRQERAAAAKVKEAQLEDQTASDTETPVNSQDEEGLLAGVPIHIKDMYQKVGFFKDRKLNEYFPVLCLQPFSMPPGAAQVKVLREPSDFVGIYVYGKDSYPTAYQSIKWFRFIPYESAVKKGLNRTPVHTEAKLQNKIPLSTWEIELRAGLAELNREAKKAPKERAHPFLRFKGKVAAISDTESGDSSLSLNEGLPQMKRREFQSKEEPESPPCEEENQAIKEIVASAKRAAPVVKVEKKAKAATRALTIDTSMTVNQINMPPSEAEPLKVKRQSLDTALVKAGATEHALVEAGADRVIDSLQGCLLPRCSYNEEGASAENEALREAKLAVNEIILATTSNASAEEDGPFSTCQKTFSKTREKFSAVLQQFSSNPVAPASAADNKRRKKKVRKSQADPDIPKYIVAEQLDHDLECVSEIEDVAYNQIASPLDDSTNHLNATPLEDSDKLISMLQQILGDDDEQEADIENVDLAKVQSLLSAKSRDLFDTEGYPSDEFMSAICGLQNANVI